MSFVFLSVYVAKNNGMRKSAVYFLLDPNTVKSLIYHNLINTIRYATYIKHLTNLNAIDLK